MEVQVHLIQLLDLMYHTLVEVVVAVEKVQVNLLVQEELVEVEMLETVIHQILQDQQVQQTLEVEVEVLMIQMVDKVDLEL
jgi:hypothetical protein